jgi:hypothetical protein
LVDVHPNDDGEAGSIPVQSATKCCPDCAETVRERARICRFCGYDFEAGSADEEETVRSALPKRSGWKVVAVVVVVFFFVLWLLGLASYTPAGTEDANNEAVMMNADGRGQPSAAEPRQASAQPAATLSASQLLRAGNPRACNAPAVRNYISETILQAVDTAYGTERAPSLKSHIRVDVSEAGETSIDRDTSQMGCSANVRISSGGGTRAVLVQYTLQPSLESEDDVLISGDWRAAQNVVVNTLALGQFFGGDKVADPELVAQ